MEIMTIEAEQHIHYVEGTEIQTYYSKEMKDIANAENKPYRFKIANRLYVRQGIELKKNFMEMLGKYDNGRIYNFNHESKNLLNKQIQKWILDELNEEVVPYMQTMLIKEYTKMMMLNLALFNGNWKKPFCKRATREAVFDISSEEKKSVFMMTRTDEFPYYQDSSVHVVKLPFVGDEVEMVLILPKKRHELANVLKNLTSKDLLRYIKMTKPTKVKIDENGVEAPNLTAADVAELSQPAAVFSANQPFLFFIVKNLQTFLLVGQNGK
uniref:Serpin domain-containing protein n=1 Tax=Setaria digitata TaxID=48799 RepID=A0A915Q855_9BILA